MISLIVGCDKDWVIGNGADIPWHLPADFANLKKVTMGHPLVMGRKTFESIGKPLPGRLNVVVTRDETYQAEGVLVVNSIEAGIEHAQKEAEENDSSEVFIFGGSGIYKYALENNLVDQAYVTHIDTEVEGDIFFPGDLLSDWVKTSSVQREKDEKNKYDMEFAVYEKKVIVNGKELSQRVEDRLEAQVEKLMDKPSLGIYVVGDDKATAMYVKKKRELADRIGVNFYEFIFEADVSEQELLDHIENHQQNVDGIVVQLPLPSHIDQQAVCNAIPVDKDPDMLNQETMAVYEQGDMSILPPVTSAVDEILNTYHIEVKDKKVFVIGKGKLVGGPVITYFKNKGVEVRAVDKQDADFSELSLSADIIVSGAGVSDLVTPDMIKDGAVLIDGGTSGSSGSLRGDIDWACAQKSSLFSRSPGGIGPLTVASLFKNFIALVEKK